MFLKGHLSGAEPKSLPAPSTSSSTGTPGHLPTLRTQGKPWVLLGKPLEFSDVSSPLADRGAWVRPEKHDWKEMLAVPRVQSLQRSLQRTRVVGAGSGLPWEH